MSHTTESPSGAGEGRHLISDRATVGFVPPSNSHPAGAALETAAAGRVSFGEKRKLSAEHNAALQRANKGRVKSDEERARIGAARGKPFTDEITAAILTQRQAGGRVSMIARNLGICCRRVTRWLQEHGGEHGVLTHAEIIAVRVQIAQTHWPVGMPLDDVTVLFNAVPGSKPMASDGVFDFIRKHKVRRSADVIAVKNTANAQTVRKPKPIPARLPFNTTGRLGGYTFTKPEPPAPVVVTAPDAPVVLPKPGADGRIEVELLPLMRWCQQEDIRGFDGSNVEALNKLLAARYHAPVVVWWP